MQRCMMTIGEFCKEHEITYNSFHSLQRKGLAPFVVNVAGSPRITIEESSAWDSPRAKQRARRASKADIREFTVSGGWE